ncbi:MAG: Gldg family protein [Nitrospinales bacterium]
MKQYASVASWLALVSAVAALLVYIVFPARIPVAVSLAAFALLNGLYFSVVNKEEIQRRLRGRTGIHGSNTLALVLVFLGILIFINILSYRHKHRFDFTEGGFFTLSQQTRKVLADLDGEVKLTAFFKTDTQEKRDFKNLIDSYLALTDKIDLSYIDPDSNPSLAKQYGIKAYGEVVFENGPRKTKIEETTEDQLTNGILKVIRSETKTIYFLEGHGEKNVKDIGQSGYSVAKKALEKVGRKVKKLSLLETAEIPNDTDLLVIDGPIKPIPEKEQDLIESFLDTGGSVLLLIDPKIEVGMMEAFLGRWGVSIRDDIIVDPLSKLFGVDRVTPVIKDFARHDITKDFSLPVVFPLLRSVAGRPVEGLKVLDLLKTGPESWSESNYQDSKFQFDKDEDYKGPVPVAVVTTKPIFKQSAAKTDKKDPLSLTPKEIKESSQKLAGGKLRGKARLVVIGDSDFASNEFFNSSGNGDFFLNTVSWMIREGNLIFIRAKERKKSPLQLTSTQGRIIFITSIFVVPALVLIPGIRSWWRRRAL